MKKISFLLLSALTFLFAACTESKFEMHQTNFWPQRPDGMRFYADQTYDTIRVYSLDPWTAEIEAENKWFSISPLSGDARPGTSAFTRLDIRMPQNTTGKNHKGRIIVKTYDDNSIAMPVYQCSWLNIMYPTPKVSGDTYEDQKVEFTLPIQAAEKETTITFHTYQEGATLSNNADWITPESTTFKKGHNAIKLKFQQNESYNERKATIVLTSGEISTPITITQEKKKDEDKDNK